MISRFQGEHRFLSNFYLCPIDYEDIRYLSVEHAYQAAKTDDLDARRKICLVGSPGEAKRMGKRVVLQSNWENEKIDVMRLLLSYKFRPGSNLLSQLYQTTPNELVEGNTWGDRFWGQCPLGIGENWLGKLLMEIRER